VLCFIYLLYASVVSPVCVLVVLAGSEFLLLLYLLFKKNEWSYWFLCCLCICHSSALCDFSGLRLFASNVWVVEEIGIGHFSEALLTLNWFFYTVCVSVVRLLYVICLDRALICFKCVRVVEEIWAGHFVRIVLDDSI
jgi:hypothetical protein